MAENAESDTANSDDWGLEGRAQWWWTYGLPTPERSWSLLTSRGSHPMVEPDPCPWRDDARVTVLKAFTFLDAAARAKDRELRNRLRDESARLLTYAAGVIQRNREAQ